MIKLLHTSDWHLGHTFHQYGREDEFEHFLSQLYEIVEREKPDVLCISGDIFDTMSPTLGSQRLWVSALENISRIAPGMPIVAIAGNHDSGSKLGVYSSILKDYIHIVGREPAYLTLKGSDGSEAVVCAVPYIPGAFYRNYLEMAGEETGEEPMRAFFAKVSAEAGLRKGDPDSPVILMAHTAVTGADFKGQDEYKFVFNDVEVLGTGYDYVALGHIHYPQTVREEESVVRYCGAPLAMGFDESYPHSVSIVTFGGGDAEVRTVELDELRKPVTLRRESPLEAGEVETFIRDYHAATLQYLRLYYLDDGNFTMEHRRRLEAAFADRDDVRLCLLVPVSPADQEEVVREIRDREITPDNIMSFDPLDIARRCFAKKRNIDMPEKLVEMLKSVIYEDTED